MVVVIIIVLVTIIAIFGKKYIIPPPAPPVPVPDPDPHYCKWQLNDKTTERWKNYCDDMNRIISDSLMALELQKEVLIDGIWKKFYQWVSDWDLFNKLDYWDLPDEVHKRGTADCDGFARFVCDVLGRFAKYLNVWWVEAYGFYRKYYQDSNGDWHYKVVAGGHAICVYKKDGKLFAFSNTTWWNDQNFQDFIEIGAMTFPEGIYLMICRHWETGKMEWQLKAEEGEILAWTNIFHRKLRKIRSLIGLKRGEQKRIRDWLKRIAREQKQERG